MKTRSVAVLLLAVLVGLVLYDVNSLDQFSRFKRNTKFLASCLPDQVERVEPLDYSDEAKWAALPHMDDFADLVPPNSNLREQQADAHVDVFFVHPTGYMGFSWNADLDSWSPPHLVARFIANIIPFVHASPFNSIGKIYAPHYREMSGLGFRTEREHLRDEALNVAFRDVLSSFEFFLDRWNKGRGIILVGHSQGSIHLARLLREKFANGSALQEKLVAAYLLGASIRNQDIPDLNVCAAPEQTRCFLGFNVFHDVPEANVLHFMLLPENATLRDLEDYVCVNPLSWKVSSGEVPASENPGSRPFLPLQRVLTGTWMGNLIPFAHSAVCRNNMLFTNQAEHGGLTHWMFPGENPHGSESNFFYLSLRKNAKLRTKAFLSENL